MAIAVIIPFFQRTEGLLADALRSVLAQRDVADVRIVVVDDASPIPATSEIARLGPLDASFRIEVLQQPNAGPAAARNRGLDSLADDVTRVAFLDSDDVWTANHLAHANRALDAGHDFYFSDLLHPGQTVSGFKRAGRLANAVHAPIAGGDRLFSYSGDMFDQIIRGNIIGTSTVVYAFERYRSQRFDEAFFSAGEDYLFWISLARAGARFCYSEHCEVTYGYGVNVYAGSGWGTPGYMRRIQNEMRYRKKLLGFPLTGEQRQFVQKAIATLRSEFIGDVFHRLTHRSAIPTALLREQFRLDPMTIWSLPIQAGQLVANRIKGRAAR